MRLPDDVARSLLVRFGGLRELLECNESSFCSNSGVGAATYAELKACLELGRRYLEARLRRAN